jgi:hypothetical protein
MMDREFIISVSDLGNALLKSKPSGVSRSSGEGWAYFQSFANAFEMAKVEAEKFIAECKVEKSIIAKKELDDAQRDSGLAKEDKGESSDDVQQGEGAGSGFPKPKRISKDILR